MNKWQHRSGYWIATNPTRDGVWALRDGGWLARKQPTDPKTGKKRDLTKIFGPEKTADEVLNWLEAQCRIIRSGGELQQSLKLKFGEYAKWLLEQRITRSIIVSPKGIQKWEYTLTCHLIPEFGLMYMDRINKTDITKWYDKISALIRSGEIAASSANTWFRILNTIFNEYYAENPSGNPLRNFESFATPPGMETYTEEEPNSLQAKDVPRFLREAFETWPQHYAMIVLGIITGLRPSHMRPIRRTGPKADLIWEERTLYVRQSQTIGDPIARTKTKASRQHIGLTQSMLNMFRWHISHFSMQQQSSDLLFPSEKGSFRAASVLDKPFSAIGEAIGLKYRVTAIAMRRTHQNLRRAAGLDAEEGRVLSGHVNEESQEDYSTYTVDEKRIWVAKLAAVAELPDFPDQPKLIAV